MGSTKLVADVAVWSLYKDLVKNATIQCLYSKTGPPYIHFLLQRFHPIKIKCFKHPLIIQLYI